MYGCRQQRLCICICKVHVRRACKSTFAEHRQCSLLSDKILRSCHSRVTTVPPVIHIHGALSLGLFVIFNSLSNRPVGFLVGEQNCPLSSIERTVHTVIDKLGKVYLLSHSGVFLFTPTPNLPQAAHGHHQAFISVSCQRLGV